MRYLKSHEQPILLGISIPTGHKKQHQIQIFITKNDEKSEEVRKLAPVYNCRKWNHRRRNAWRSLKLRRRQLDDGDWTLAYILSTCENSREERRNRIDLSQKLKRLRFIRERDREREAYDWKWGHWREQASESEEVDGGRGTEATKGAEAGADTRQLMIGKRPPNEKRLDEFIIARRRKIYSVAGMDKPNKYSLPGLYHTLIRPDP